MERLNPLNDYLFLKFMGEEGDEEQCLAFLNAVLQSKGSRPAKLIKILENKTFTAEVQGGKTSILDVRVETDSGEKVNIEVQLRDLHNMEKRTLQYWGMEYTSGITAGKDYIELPRVITINIVDFDFIDLDDFHTCFHLWEDDHKEYLLTDVLEIHFISMKKFRKQQTKDLEHNTLERWLTFFDLGTPQETLEEVVKMDPAIAKADERITFVSQDKELLRNYYMRAMAESDIVTAQNTAFEKGIGKNNREIAQKMFFNGEPIEKIQMYTGLDEKTIRTLSAER